jgi:hypothetical protein
MWLLDRMGFVPSDRDRLALRALSRLSIWTATSVNSDRPRPLIASDYSGARVVR